MKYDVPCAVPGKMRRMPDAAKIGKEERTITVAPEPIPNRVEEPTEAPAEPIRIEEPVPA